LSTIYYLGPLATLADIIIELIGNALGLLQFCLHYNGITFARLIFDAFSGQTRTGDRRHNIEILYHFIQFVTRCYACYVLCIDVKVGSEGKEALLSWDTGAPAGMLTSACPRDTVAVLEARTSTTTRRRDVDGRAALRRVTIS
jgi:hypothetical protein